VHPFSKILAGAKGFQSLWEVKRSGGGEGRGTSKARGHGGASSRGIIVFGFWGKNRVSALEVQPWRKMRYHRVGTGEGRHRPLSPISERVGGTAASVQSVIVGKKTRRAILTRRRRHGGSTVEAEKPDGRAPELPVARGMIRLCGRDGKKC